MDILSVVMTNPISVAKVNYYYQPIYSYQQLLIQLKDHSWRYQSDKFKSDILLELGIWTQIV